PGGRAMNPRAIVEAALFSAGKALTPEELARTTRLEPDVIREHLRALSKEYTKRESAIEVAQIGTKWTMQIRSDYSERARALALPTTRYFAEFFGLKSTDREGIRRLMAEKAGVPYKERPEGTLSDDATEASPLPALESGAAVPVSTSPSPVAAGNE